MRKVVSEFDQKYFFPCLWQLFLFFILSLILISCQQSNENTPPKKNVPYEILDKTEQAEGKESVPQEKSTSQLDPFNWQNVPATTNTPSTVPTEDVETFMALLQEQHAMSAQTPQSSEALHASDKKTVLNTSVDVSSEEKLASAQQPIVKEAAAKQHVTKSEEVKVGLLLPLSGPHKDIGNALLNAAQLALFDIADPYLEIIPRDTQGTEEGAIAAAKQAIEDGAKLIIGPLFSHEAVAVYPYVHRAGVKIITFSNDSRIAKSDLFVFGFIPDQTLIPQMHFLENHHPKNILILLGKTNYAQYLKTFFMAHLSPALQGKTTFIEGTLSEETIPENIETYDVIWIPEANTAITNFVDHLKYKYPELNALIVGSPAWDNATILKDPSFKKAIYMGPNPALRAKFMQNYKTHFHKDPPPMVTLAYDALSLAAIFVRHHPKDPFRHEQFFNKEGFKALNGLFRFTEQGIVERRFPVIEIQGRQCIKILENPQPFLETKNTKERHAAIYCYGKR